MHYKAVHSTAVLFLQNDPGFAKWGPTPERLQELSAAYRQSGRSHGSVGSSSSSSEAKDRDSGREQGPSREPHSTYNTSCGEEEPQGAGLDCWRSGLLGLSGSQDPPSGVAAGPRLPMT